MAPDPEPIETLSSQVPRDGWRQLVALGRYMAGTDVHTYAFSVAANVILSLFPFIVLLLTITRQVFHSRSMESVVGDMMRSFLPVGQDFIMRNMQMLAHPRKGTQVFSLVMLLITSTGVFLPLEVALNSVWGVKQNRSYVHNQLISLLLAFAVGALSMMSVAFTAGQQSVVTWIFFGHTDNIVFRFFATWFLRILGGLVSILLFFLIYWVLPNRKVPARAVLPTAVVIGFLWEIAKFLYIKALPWPGLPICLRSVLYLGGTDDVGFSVGATPSGRRTLLSDTLHACSGPPGRAGGLARNASLSAGTIEQTLVLRHPQASAEARLACSCVLARNPSFSCLNSSSEFQGVGGVCSVFCNGWMPLPSLASPFRCHCASYAAAFSGGFA